MARMVKKQRISKKKLVSSEDVLRAVLYLAETMATKEDIVEIKARMATRKHIEALKDDVDALGEDINSLTSDVQDVRTQIVTKQDVQSLVDSAKDDVLEEIRPIAHAIDKDSVTVVSHEKRITVLERKVGVLTK